MFKWLSRLFKKDQKAPSYEGDSNDLITKAFSDISYPIEDSYSEKTKKRLYEARVVDRVVNKAMNHKKRGRPFGSKNKPK